ncbi:hypothetical protein [Solwaraspora sp. WMMD792]|uniref:hypothetical protein n=1 Tax=Solwaraspora sp. WMMD792 TaxID=3016099 RepID=UPI0024175BF2|nr:hypothetical protein [Solwaraspora sp. WMMD792]MDG4772620.1 hypothetical protein [Solwaraspora sp. WMMD792]
MQADRVVEALRRHVFQPGEDVAKRFAEPERVTVLSTTQALYEAEPAGWRIGTAAWVDSAVRVARDSSLENFVATYGFVFSRDGGALFLNDAAAIRELGRGLGAGLDPLAYAELLAELYSGQRIDDPVVFSFAATAGFRPGWLIADVEEFLRKHPSVDPSLVSPPRASQEGGVSRIDFLSHNYYLVEFGAAIDIYRWTVTAPAGQPASWVREPVAQRLTLPPS